MSYVIDDIVVSQPVQRSWKGIIATTALSFSDRISITIPGMDSKIRWENVRWQSRNDLDLPERGDECLVVFDDNMEPWVVCWWPF